MGCVFLAVACLVAPPGFANDGDKILGIWKLVSYEVEVQAIGQIGPVMGEKPTGYAAFLPEYAPLLALRQTAATERYARGWSRRTAC
jgi:hypothetical protein